MRRFLARFIAFVRTSAADAELSRELAAHLQMLEDAYIAGGMSADEARLAARRAFGGQVEQTRLRHRDARSFRALDDWWLDVKLGARMLTKHSGLTIVGGLGMAVAIAISTASFAFFYESLYSTLPLPQGERIVALENWDTTRNNEFRQAIHDLHLWRAEMTTMEEVGAFRPLTRNLIVPGGVSEPVRLAEMTASAFRIARVAPVLGRPLVDDDERAGATPVVVIGHDVWQSRFGADPTIIGREVRFGNTTHTIVGVMPQGFLFPVNDSYWVPLRARPSDYPRGEGPVVFIFGRLADGVTLEQAKAELETIGARNAAAFPASHATLRPRAMPYSHAILDIQDVSLFQVSVMQFTMSILLVIVAVNIAVLVYARTATRRGEIAVRTALGASRGRIVGQLFVEAFVLAALAAAGGLLLAQIGLDQARQIIQLEGARPPYWIDYSIPGAAVAYIIVLTLMSAAIAGVLPALQVTGRRVQFTLRELGGGTGLQLGRTWTTLIVAQVAFAVAALPLAVGIGWSEVQSVTNTPVFEAERILAAQVAVDPEPQAGVDPQTYRAEASARFAAFQDEFVSRIEAEPWAADVTLAQVPPGQENSGQIEVERLGDSNASTHHVQVNHVGRDFFEAFDIALLSGRRLTNADAGTDDPAAVRGVVVNRAFAQRVLGGANPVGRRIRYVEREDQPQEPDGWLEIVGVVSDLHSNQTDPARVAPAMYHPLVGTAVDRVSVIVRVAGGTADSFAAPLREIAIGVDPTVRLVAYPLSQIYRQGNVAMRLVAGGLALVVVSVLLLSAAGIYALMSFTVSQRQKEIGIRAALGADAPQLLRNVFARSAMQLGAGIAIGVVLAIVFDMASDQTLLGNLRGILLPAMAALMLVVGLAASAGPARRGLRVQPIQALRVE